MITPKDNFVNLAGFAGSGLAFVPGLNLTNSVSTACKHYSNSKNKREVTIQRTKGAKTFKITRTNDPTKTTDEIINYYLKHSEEEIETDSNDYRENCHGNPHNRVKLPRSFLLSLCHTILPSFHQAVL